MNSTALDQDTIAAIATPSGKGGVGIIRLSGSNAYAIAKKITQCELQPRYAHFSKFYQNNSTGKENLLDEGIAIYFKAPHSFTGEDVVELQGHGGPVILDELLKECVRNGARLARPGEFSERAFLNDKLDLAQAEAIADLIDSSSIEAARNAMRSLQGEFSNRIHTLVSAVIELRIFVEAAIDFPEEEVDFLEDGKVQEKLQSLIDKLENILATANQGRILREGMTVVIAGKPNAGKSSLLNALAGHEAAIVTDIEGTTRDVLKEQILIDGMPLHIIDTAGLRDSTDTVEQIGIERAWKAIADADAILLVTDSSQQASATPDEIWPEFMHKLESHEHLTLVRNKCDISKLPAGLDTSGAIPVVTVSARQDLGMQALRDHLKACAGLHNQTEGGFTARRRHLQALETALNLLHAGMQQLQSIGAGELLAEDLRQCQQALNEITGAFTSDDLLGKIFSSFCIGK